MQTIKLTIIIVNYNSRTYLEECLASLFEKTDFKLFEIIIVNNGKKNELAGLTDSFPFVTIIQTENNLGFGSANNLGAKKACGELLFFLNPDTKIIFADFQKIYEKFQTNPNIGIAGVRLIDENGNQQRWGLGAEVTLKQIFKNKLSLQNHSKNETQKDPDWISGTALFISKKLFNKLNGFDEKFFMYFEDVDLCKRARKSGNKVVCFNDFSILHYGGKSYYQKNTQKKQYYLAQDYYFKKHFGNTRLFWLKFFRLIGMPIFIFLSNLKNNWHKKEI
jgi:GT2 family glycosyltransferase